MQFYILPLELRNMSKPIFLAIGLLVATAILSQTMVSNASIQNDSSVSNENSLGTPYIPGEFYDATLEHINNAQAALQNGDTESANNHLELAKQSLQGNQTGQ